MTTITTLPAAPSRSDPANFATVSDAFLGALPTFGTQVNTVAVEINTNATAAQTNATSAMASQTAAAASATIALGAVATSGAVLWVSGTTYAVGNVVYSPLNLANYRRKTAGAGSTDPSLDATNWTLTTPASVGLTPIGSLVAFDSDQLNNTVTGADGAVYLKTGVIADAATYPLAPAAPWFNVTASAVSTAPVVPTGIISMAFGNGVWVAGLGGGQIAISTDGMTWGAATQLTGMIGSVTVVFANSVFVAVGTNAVSAKSSAGQSWTYGTLPFAGTWYALAYGASTWVAARNATTDIATSSDGVTWTARTNSRTWASNGNAPSVLQFGAGLFVLLDGSGAAAQLSTSPDGITWTNRTITAPSSSWASLSFGASIFVAKCYDATNGVYTSTDGITWTGRAVLLNTSYPAGFVGSKFVHITNGTVSYSTDGISWTTDANGGFTSLNVWWYATNGTYHMAGTGTAAELQRSNNAIRWGKVVPVSTIGEQVVVAGGNFITAFKTAGYQGVQASADGITWYQITMANTDTYARVGYCNGIYLVCGVSYCFTSPDLATWTSRTPPTYRGSFLRTANGKMFSLDSGVTTGYSLSTDGTTFANYTLATNATWFDVVYGNGIYLAYDRTSIVNTSANGTSGWTLRSTAFSGSIAQMVFASGYFVCVTSTGYWYRSTDGITWTAMTYGFGAPISGPTLVTDGTAVWALNSGTSFVVWSGTGSVVYKRNISTFASYGGNGFDHVKHLGAGVIYGLGNGNYYKGSITADKVLNDTNLKTYHATAAEQTNFYKRLA